MFETGVSLLLSIFCGLFLLVLAAGLVFTVYIYYLHWKVSHIPSPQLPSFYLGHLADLLKAHKETGNDELPVQELFIAWSKDAGSQIYAVHFLTLSMVILMDPDDIKKVAMGTKWEKPISVGFYKNLITVMGERFLGNGLITIPDYETWKKVRRVHNPAFHKSFLKGLAEPLNESVDRFIGKIKPLADGKTLVPMKLHFAEYTADVVSKVAFGMDFTKKWNDELLGLKHIQGNGSLCFLLDHSLKGAMKNFLYQDLYGFFHPIEAEGYRETLRALRMIGRDCINSRIEDIRAGNPVPNDILTLILQMASSSEGIDIEQFVDDFMNYYGAGQETASTLLAFATVLIHQHSHVLNRLQAEVDEVLDGRSNVTVDDLEKLQYTEQVLLEALRFHPPLFGIARGPPKGGLELSGYHIPYGVQITISTSILCRMPEYFDDPDTFNPSRWDPGNQRPSTFVFFPFGAGHRACIGKQLAMMEAKMALARLIQTYKLSLSADYKIVVAQRLSDQPKDTVPCMITMRA